LTELLLRRFAEQFNDSRYAPGQNSHLSSQWYPVADDNTAADLQRLSFMLAKTGTQKLIILDDLLHAAKGRDARTLDAFSDWRSKHSTLGIYLVRRNHDRSAGDPPETWNIQTVNGPTPRP
jgi:metallophosphoesterase superfamily enzyme